MAKLSNEEVDYKNEVQVCGLCVRFQPPDACEIVEGKKSEYGYCNKFEYKDNSDMFNRKQKNSFNKPKKLGDTRD